METSRPPVPEPRCRQLKVRLTETEFCRLVRRADFADLTISELVRLTLPLQADTPPVPTSGASKKTDVGGLSGPAYRRS